MENDSTSNKKRTRKERDESGDEEKEEGPSTFRKSLVKVLRFDSGVSYALLRCRPQEESVFASQSQNISARSNLGLHVSNYQPIPTTGSLIIDVR